MRSGDSVDPASRTRNVTSCADRSCDVLIVGAGPAGLTLANLLGLCGLSVIVVESSEKLIDYPRGVSMYDETLRVFQTAGLVEAVREHTAPDQWIRYITAKGRCFASVEPRTREFGWPRRNSFIQPLVDRVLLASLERFDRVEVLFERTLTAFTQDEAEVMATVKSPEGNPQTIDARFIVGCEGGRSLVRKILGMNRAGNMLKRFGVGAGDQVIVAVSPSLSLIASVLGAMKVGATAIVVPDALTSQTSAKLNAATIKVLIVDASRLEEFSTIKPDLKRLVVGDVGEGQHSFLQEMRGSASSLDRLTALSDAPALAIANGDKLSFIPHDQIGSASNNETFGKSDIGNILVHLVRGENVQIQ